MRPDTRRAAAQEVTRQLVLASARREFAKKGFLEANVRDIAAGAGRSTGAIFGNFKDKESLFEAAMERKAPLRVVKDMLQRAAWMGEVPPLGNYHATHLLQDLFGEDACQSS